MRILLVGGAGMLGHQLFLQLRSSHEVKVTLRRDVHSYVHHRLFDASNAYGDLDAQSTDRLLEVLSDFRPDVIVNSIGLVKQLAIAKRIISGLQINALLPHQLALLARTIRARLLHFSTDCVFSGRKGNYSESDTPDPEDLYGRAKLLGEVDEPHCLTLRTSLIGHELERKTSLIEWFLCQERSVRGFRRAIFSGFTTIEMARIVKMLIEMHPEAHGVWHVSSDPIDKYALLKLVKKHYRLDTRIVPDEEFQCDRSLDSTRFRERFHYQPPPWESMIAEMSKTRSMQDSER